MRHWFEDLPGVTGFRPVEPALLAAWPDRAMEARLQHLRYCPVLPQELYQVARQLPLVVVAQPTGPMLMAELASEGLRQPAFDAEGRFLRSYRPLVSRLLPFCAMPGGETLRLTDETAPPGPERAEDLQRQIVQMLRGQAAGLSRLSEAASLLIDEGLLAEAPGNGMRDGDPARVRAWHPAPADLDAETAAAAANLAAMPVSFLALRMLGAIEFSALHRREAPVRRSDADSLRELLGRNEALRRQTFLTRDEMLDFSGLVSPAPAEAQETLTED
ncbi:SapC family protein [Paracoccus ravus]|uniref:SapC family protein n=1 Tax=Paracoccus ravus TaxID=2447760 RepID=UPI001431633E|nr:SapC family protein [Paracoccus ravus]